jgi:DNA invertase Pin-like site-specific DNA recombinase
MEIYGYIRVSSADQNEDRQLAAMDRFRVENIFIDKRLLICYITYILFNSWT